MKPLADYLFDTLKIKPVKTKSGNGFMIYDVPTTLNLQHLTELVEGAKEGWQVKDFDGEYVKGIQIKAPSIYFGLVKDNGMDKDDFLTS